jgi:hypothetical protein
MENEEAETYPSNKYPFLLKGDSIRLPTSEEPQMSQIFFLEKHFGNSIEALQRFKKTIPASLLKQIVLEYVGSVQNAHQYRVLVKNTAVLFEFARKLGNFETMVSHNTVNLYSQAVSIMENIQVYETNAALGHGELAYLVCVNNLGVPTTVNSSLQAILNGTSKADYLIVATYPNNDGILRSYKVGDTIQDLEAYYVQPSKMDIKESSLYTPLLQYFLNSLKTT